MGEGTRQASEVDAAQDDGGERSPEQIEQEIEATRAELGDTVEALAQKADVKGRAQKRAAEVKEDAQRKKDEALSKAREVTPDQARDAASQVALKAGRNPAPLAVAGAFVAGIAIGRLTSR